MEIIKWEPLPEIDRLFDDRSLFGFRKASDFATDLYEEKGAIVAKVAVPDIDPNNISVSVEKDMLNITGSREEEKETKGREYYSKEIRHGSFTRHISLPKVVDVTHVTAQYKDGVLLVTLPVIANAEERVVKVDVKK